MPLVRPLLLSTLLCGTAAAQAATTAPTLLATLSFDEAYTLGIGPSPSTALQLQFSYSLAPGNVTDLTTLVFDDRLFTAADAGQTFTLASALEDPQLPAFFARATNGLDDDIRNDAIGDNGGGRGLVAPESARLMTLVPVTGPDLQGYTLSSLELFIAELTIDPTASDSLPHWTISGELRFYGEPTPVPLPGTLALFASAVAAGLRLRRLI